MIWGNGGMRGVHRVAWEAWNGTIPAGMWVLHHCDNPPCCNPAHLYLGTPADNNRDRDERGRHRALRGSQNGQAKLTEDDALEIRERYAAGGVSQYALAAEYGVHQSAVWHVINGTGWRHAHAEAQA